MISPVFNASCPDPPILRSNFFQNSNFFQISNLFKSPAAPTLGASSTDGSTDAGRQQHRRKHRRWAPAEPTGACTWEHRRWAPAAPTQSASSTDGQHRRGQVPRRKAPTKGTDGGMYTLGHVHGNTDAGRQQHRRRAPAAPTDSTDGGMYTTARVHEGAPLLKILPP